MQTTELGQQLGKEYYGSRADESEWNLALSTMQSSIVEMKERAAMLLFFALRDVGRFLRWIFFAKDLASTRQSVNVSV